MDYFVGFIYNCSLSHVTSFGLLFIVCNLVRAALYVVRHVPLSKVWKHLHRMLYNIDRIYDFPSFMVQVLICTGLDHCLLLLTLLDLPSKLKPFRFQLMWLRHKDFRDIVSQNLL